MCMSQIICLTIPYFTASLLIKQVYAHHNVRCRKFSEVCIVQQFRYVMLLGQLEMEVQYLLRASPNQYII